MSPKGAPNGGSPGGTGTVLRFLVVCCEDLPWKLCPVLVTGRAFVLTSNKDEQPLDLGLRARGPSAYIDAGIPCRGHQRYQPSSMVDDGIFHDPLEDIISQKPEHDRVRPKEAN